MWSSYADCVRGCAREVDTWLRQYQQQNEEDALEIARILSIQVNDITSYILIYAPTSPLYIDEISVFLIYRRIYLAVAHWRDISPSYMQTHVLRR